MCPKKRVLDASNVLSLDQDGGYTGVFTLQKLVKLCTCDLCGFLVVSSLSVTLT